MEEVKKMEEVGILSMNRKKKTKLMRADYLDICVKNKKEKVIMGVKEEGGEVGGVTRKKKKLI